MKVILTLDYELYLGAKAGTVERCLVEPMAQLLKATAFSGAKFTLLVDAAYLYMLNKEKDSHEALKKDYKAVTDNLMFLQEQGHDIQLHVHPQWYFSKFDGKEWCLDTVHYKLCDVDEKKMTELFVESKRLLDAVVGKQTVAFRAGGFSAQPTALLGRLFKASGVRIDTSVCPGTSYDSDCQKYDYTNVPNKCIYRFSDDICKEDVNGDFLEVPISMIKVSPVFHWKLAVTKLAVKFGGGAQFRRMGDGQSVKTTGSSILTRMTRTVDTMATIDEFKASLLKSAYRKAKKSGQEYFCVLGHPKLATPYSVGKLAEFCEYVKSKGDEFATLSDCYEG
ncbi:MAG: hypothetical protein IJ928_00525 [Prevotella sp.]|nr:hypothetical protein [Prevotella sp.]